MKLAAIHALLLLATLGFAYQTWTRDVTGPIAPGSVLIWDADVEDIVGITYESEAQNVWIERREDEAGTYHWATVTIRARETGTAQAAGDTAASTSTKEPPRVMSFVVGQEGDILLDEVASLRALRDLGTASEEQESEYGLADATAKIVVQMDGGSRELEVGGKAWGGNDRYVRDSETGRVYVLPGTFVGRLEAAEYQLPERRLHLFADSRVNRVVVQTARAERVMQRTDAPQGSTAIWARPETPDEPDQTFANFMDRLKQIWAGEFVPDVDPRTLTSVVRIDYFDASDRPLGHLELFRESDEGAGGQYYVQTEHTRVLTRLNANIGEQLDADVSQLF